MIARREQVEGLDETTRRTADDVLSSRSVDIAPMQAMHPACSTGP